MATSGREGTPLPEPKRSQEFSLTEYDAWQERQRGRNWTLNDVPFYKGKGESLSQNPFDWHDYDYLNYYDQVFGRKCGSAGIGKLRDVGILEITEDDDYADHPYYREDPAYMDRDGFFSGRAMDLPKMRDQQARYAELLAENGVNVYWIRYPDKPMGAFGPMTNQMSAAELTVLPGGSIIAKKAYALAPTSGFGRTEYLARWAFWNLGIPVSAHGGGQGRVGDRGVPGRRRLLPGDVRGDQRGGHGAGRAGDAAGVRRGFARPAHLRADPQLFRARHRGQRPTPTWSSPRSISTRCWCTLRAWTWIPRRSSGTTATA